MIKYKVHDLIDGFDCGCTSCYKNRSLNVEIGKYYRPIRSNPNIQSFHFRTTQGMCAIAEPSSYRQATYFLQKRTVFDKRGVDIFFCLASHKKSEFEIDAYSSSLSSYHSLVIAQCLTSKGILYIYGGDLVPIDMR